MGWHSLPKFAPPGLSWLFSLAHQPVDRCLEVQIDKCSRPRNPPFAPNNKPEPIMKPGAPDGLIRFLTAKKVVFLVRMGKAIGEKCSNQNSAGGKLREGVIVGFAVIPEPRATAEP